jgi:dCMP deaminase
VGCVLVDSNTDMVLTAACNGFARGVCDHRLPSTRPDKYSYIIHSEINMLAMCAMHGISTNNKYLVCTMTPCVSCMRTLFQAGITRVIAKDRYKDFADLKNMRDITISESVTKEGFIDLTYKPRLPRIVFVGSNPSNDSPDNSAFHPDTATGKRVREWVHGLDIDVYLLNVHNHKTPMNRKLNKKETDDGLMRLGFELREIDPDLLVTVGETARRTLSMFQCKRHHMPHPSGLCRFWNDKDKSLKAIDELRSIISKV